MGGGPDVYRTGDPAVTVGDLLQLGGRPTEQGHRMTSFGVAEHDVEQAADQHADGPGLPGRCKHSGSVAHVVYAQLFMTSYGSYPR